MITYIHCTACGEEKKKTEALRAVLSTIPGEWCWFVKGTAATPSTCAQCNVHIPEGQRCQAMTRYTDQAGYEPWEHEYLDDMGPGDSGRKPEAPSPKPGVTTYTVLLVKNSKRNVGAKVVGIDNSEVRADNQEAVLNLVRARIQTHDPRACERHFALHVRRVGAAEFSSSN
jgi:hypothetical protein